MASKTRPFKTGDWIVHATYGVGKIRSIETKHLGEKQTRYFKVDAHNSTFFVPVEGIDIQRIRPVASRAQFRKALKLLNDTPHEFEGDHNARRRQIAEMAASFSPEATVELVRDLAGRRAARGLNDHEERTFERAAGRLAREWAIAEEMEFEDAQVKLNAVLDEATAKAG
ncbi:MAG: hypothetical protein HYZ26_06415 [Chloroflexi bacterium]|nr:hypothetical protein [Chloroflexota bacterium]